jgi:hypothetical protein
VSDHESGISVIADKAKQLGWSVEDEIRILLKHRRKKDTSKEACQRFATELIQSVFKWWSIDMQSEPGMGLTIKQWQKVGRELDRLLLQTGRYVPRLESPPYKHRP